MSRTLCWKGTVCVGLEQWRREKGKKNGNTRTKVGRVPGNMYKMF